MTCKKSGPYPARAYTTLVVLVLTTAPVGLFLYITSSFQSGGGGFIESGPWIKQGLGVEVSTHTCSLKL